MSALILAALLILPAGATSQSDNASAARRPAFACGFERESDRNYDRWPDGWQRRRGREFPLYVPVTIASPEELPSGAPPPHDRSCLRVDLDGGAVALYSPFIEVAPLFSYDLTAQLCAWDLSYNTVSISLELYDDAQQLLETHSSSPMANTHGWREAAVRSITPQSPQARQGRIVLHITPGGRADLSGTALFDDIRLEQLPRMSLKTNSLVNFFSISQEITITCDVSGVLGSRIRKRVPGERSPRLTFELLDVEGQVLQTSHCRLAHPEGTRDCGLKKTALQNSQSAIRNPKSEIAATWRPRIERPGYYRVRASIELVATSGSPGGKLSRATALAVVDSLPVVGPVPTSGSPPSPGEYGWSLANNHPPVPLTALADLMSQCGVGWVKAPVWLDASEAAKAERLSRFAERLAAKGTRFVGVLDKPPERIRQMFSEKAPKGSPKSAATIFDDEEPWKAAIDPVMTGVSLNIRHWQLGADSDGSFIGYPGLAHRLAKVKRHMERFGREVHLGVMWNWLHQAPASDGQPPWDFLAWRAQPRDWPLTSDELAAHLDCGLGRPKGTRDCGLKSTALQNPQSEIPGTLWAPQSAAQRWVTLQPLPQKEYDDAARIRDLVQRMIVCQIYQVDAALATDPFHRATGLLKPNGAPGELLLPWRTCALLLAGADYLGSVQLPQGSANHIFVRGGQAVMVVWNERPTTEILYLGEQVRQIDVWGRQSTPVSHDHRQQIDVTWLPTFVTGLNPHVARWRMAAQLMRTRLASELGRRQQVGLLLENTFGQGVSGEAVIQAPLAWSVAPDHLRVKLAAAPVPVPTSGSSPSPGRRRPFPQVGAHRARSHKWEPIPFDVLLKGDARIGRQALPIDFDIVADRRYRFRVWCQMQVGLGDVSIELTSHLDERGRLVVKQRLTNRSDQPISFNCELFAPLRRRLRRPVMYLTRGHVEHTYTIPKGKELLGKQLLLRAKEIDGPRVLNYPFTPQ